MFSGGLDWMLSCLLNIICTQMQVGSEVHVAGLWSGNAVRCHGKVLAFVLMHKNDWRMDFTSSSHNCSCLALEFLMGRMGQGCTICCALALAVRDCTTICPNGWKDQHVCTYNMLDRSQSWCCKYCWLRVLATSWGGYNLNSFHRSTESCNWGQMTCWQDRVLEVSSEDTIY